jgi:Mrp family chromosome partitioning ATPase
LVAQHRVTTDTQVRRAVQALRRVDASVIGVVLNRVQRSRGGPYGYSYYRYERDEKPVKPRPRPREDIAADRGEKQTAGHSQGGGR